MSRVGTLRCLVVGACILAAGCLDRGAENILGATVVDPLGVQVWTVILTDSAGGVWVAQTDSAFEVHAAPAGAGGPLWSVLDSAPGHDRLTLAARWTDARWLEP